MMLVPLGMMVSACDHHSPMFETSRSHHQALVKNNWTEVEEWSREGCQNSEVSSRPHDGGRKKLHGSISVTSKFQFFNDFLGLKLLSSINNNIQNRPAVVVVVVI